MQIISISRGSQSLGIEFAEKLSENLRYECVSREDLLEAATERGIPVGKLETAIVKPHSPSERLALELEHFKALATSILCEKALDHDIVYHGRTGHLLLRGVDHILKVRVVGDMEQRIAAVENRLRLSRKKAQKYIDAVEEDRRRWVREFYHEDWDAYSLYDFIVNLSQLSVGNAAMAACSMVDLPEFRSTPASELALRDLQLTALARLALAESERTGGLTLRLSASKGIVYVTYSYRQAKQLDDITDVLGKVPGVRQVVFTEAQTNLLWIQERYDVDTSAYDEVLRLANRWNAAVEILQITPGEDYQKLPVHEDVVKRGLEEWRKTGILDDRDEQLLAEPQDVVQVYEKLISDGRAGGKRSFSGTVKHVMSNIDRSTDYRLIILDNIFLSKGPEARQRMTQDWSNTLSDKLKTPVVSMKEIQRQYRFGFKQLMQLAVSAAIAALTVFAVFHFERPILEFLHREGTTWRVIATTCVVLFVPTFAFVYSKATGLLLRSIHLD